MAIVRNRGYVQLRRGLFEHVQNGEMSIGECFLYTAILANADPATGIWISSAGMLSSFYSIPDRTCKDWLAKLEVKGYLRRFRVQGKHGQYPILVHKYQCTEGALKGMFLNARESESYKSPRYEACPDARTDGAPAVALTVPQKEREGENGRKKPSRATKTREADQRHQSFKSAIFAYWQSKNPDVEMPWDGAEGGQLDGLLRSSPQTTLEQFQQFLHNRSRSEVNHSERPSRWLHSVTRFAGGPIDRFGNCLPSSTPSRQDPLAGMTFANRRPQ